MNVKIIKRKGAPVASTIVDINGQERNEAECFIKFEGNYHGTEVKKNYIPIITADTPPENDDFVYYVDFGSRGMRVSTDRRVAWIHFQNCWMWAERGQNFVDVFYYNENMQTKTGKGLYDPYITVEAFNKEGDTIFIVDHDTAIQMGFLPSKSSNTYFTPSLKSTNKGLYNSLISKSSFGLPIRTSHHADENNECYNRVVELFEKEVYHPMTKETRYMSRLLNGKSFGIEYEVVDGTIPSPMLGKLGVTALTDGSIGRQNYEITTVPLAGIKGLEAVREQCKALTDRTRINSNCALHIHVGNISNDKLTFLALYSLFHRLQSDIYACHPYYKQYEIGTLGKSKEYSRMLPDLGIKRNTIFNQQSKEEFTAEVNKWHRVLFEYFACTEESADHNRGNRESGEIRTIWGQKWHCPTRYYWANFINYLFSKSGTIEFRIHEPSTNFTKVSNFLLLCIALVRYAERYPESILQYDLKITLDDVLEELRTNFTGTPIKGKFGAYCNEIADYMLSYIKLREKTFSHQLSSANKESAVNHNNTFGLIGVATKKMFRIDAAFHFEFNGRHHLY